MNQKKEKGATTPTSKKPCSRCKDHSNKNTSAVTTRKPPSQKFSGMKFNMKLNKVTIAKPFSFDSSSRNESKSPRRMREKSVEKQVTTEENDLKDASGKQIKVIMDTLKISRSTRSASSERSPPPEKTKDEKISKNPAIDSLTSKKPCSRSSRTSTKETCNGKPAQVATNVVELSKTPTKPLSPRIKKSETQQASKAATTKTVCTKVAKLQTKPKEGIPKVSKPKSNTGKSVNFDVNPRDNARFCNSEKSKSESPNAEKQSLYASNKEKSESSSLKEKKEFVCSKAEKVEEGVLISEIVHSAVSFKETSEVSKETTSEYEISIAAEPESMLLNGLRHETEWVECEISNEIKKECDLTKSTSKIPRIAHSNSGQKIHASIKEEMMAQAISFENVCPNMNQPSNHMEDILV